MRSFTLSLALLALPTAAWSQTQPAWPVQQPPPQMEAPPPPPPGGVMLAQPTMEMAAQTRYNLVYGPEPLSSGARLTLVVTQGINGAAFGASVALLAGSETPGVYSGALLLGAGVGVVGALLASRDGITEGQEAAVDRGTLFGAMGATFLWMGVNSGLSAQAVGGIYAAGLAVGTVGGVLGAMQRPLAGRVEFAGSMGLWAAFLSGHMFFLTNGYSTLDGSGRDSLRIFGLSTLALMGGGLAAGALLAPSVPVSAARMRWINLAGLGGWAVVGLSSALFASSDGGNSVRLAYSLGSIIGAGAGLALGVVFTSDTDRGWDRGQARRNGGGRLIVMPGGPADAPLGASLSGTF